MTRAAPPPVQEPGGNPAHAHLNATPSPGSRWDRVRLRLSRYAWALPLIVFLLALVPRLFGLDVFLTADEDDQLRFAAGFLTAILDLDWARAVLLGYPGVPTMALGSLALALRYMWHVWGYAPLPDAGPDMVTTLAHVADHPLVYLPAARGVMVIAASLAVLVMYLLMGRIVGRRIAFLAAVLIAFEPFFVANSRVLHVDAPLAYFMFLSFLAFWLYLTEGRWGWLALSGLCGALATLSKTPGAILGPILVAAGLIYALHPPVASAGSQDTVADTPLPTGQRWRRFIVAIAIWGIVAAAAFYALWPSMWADPTSALKWITKDAVIALKTPHPSSGVFWGITRSDQSPFYYLISLPLRLSPLAFIGVIVGVVVTWRWRRHRPLLLALWAYAILFIIPVSIVGRRGDRYILPLYLSFGLLAAIALSWLAQRPGRARPSRLVDERPAAANATLWNKAIRIAPWRAFRGRGRWVLAIAVVVQVLFVLNFHPYYFQYFNPLLGGGRTAPYLINIGWGEGLDRAAAWVNGRPDSAQKTVAAWYGGQFAPFFKGHTIDLSANEPALTADYTVFYINQVQRGFPSRELLAYFRDREPMETIRLGHVDYAQVYPGPVIAFVPPHEIQVPVDSTLGGAVHLMGYDITPSSIPADDEIRITLHWQTLSPVSGDYNVYIRVLDDVGNVWGQVDRLPLGGLWRTNQWQPGAFIRDEYRLSLRPGTLPDVYHLEVSMYSFATGETLGVARNIGQIEVTPARRMSLPRELTMQHTVRKTLAPRLELMGYDLGQDKIGPGQRLPLTLYWRTTRSLDKDYSVIFDAKSVAGDEGGSWIEDLGSQRYPTSQWRWGEALVTMHQLQMPANASSGFYVLNMRLMDVQTEEKREREILGKMEFVERARDFDTPTVQHPVGLEHDNVAQLIGYDLPETSVAAGDAFPLTLYWRALDGTRTSYSVFIHVVGPDGVIRGQWDSVPGSGMLPTTGWLEGEVITDQYLVPMAENAPPWQYTILVGMYDPWTGERLPVAGFPDRDSIALGMIKGR